MKEKEKENKNLFNDHQQKRERSANIEELLWSFRKPQRIHHQNHQQEQQQYLAQLTESVHHKSVVMSCRFMELNDEYIHHKAVKTLCMFMELNGEYIHHKLVVLLYKFEGCNRKNVDYKLEMIL